jgi:PST family polysaccharide transporter
MNGGVIILGLFAQPGLVAIYSMAEQLYKAMQSAVSPAASAAYPYMAKEKDLRLMIRLAIAVVSLVILGALIGFFFAPILVTIVFGSDWLVAIPVLNVFFLAIIIHASAVMLGYPFAATLGRLDVANKSVISGALMYLVLLPLWFAIDAVNPLGLAILMLISEFCVFLYRALLLIPIAIGKL